MPLRFPHTRLFMHNLLADGQVSGSEAIALTACEFGLLDHSAVREVSVEASQQTNCPCMDTARQVLENYFCERAKQSSAPNIDASSVWSAVEADASNYELQTARKSCRNTCDECVEPEKARHDCSKFAPVLFDLLLQQIRRYI